MVSTQANIFSLLKIDDEDDSGHQNAVSNQKLRKNQEQQSSSKKKNKKKKKGPQNTETEELQHLAFNKSTPNKGKSRTTSTSSASGDASQAQWDEWKRLDSEYAADNFEKDLQAALLQSKIEHEQKEEFKKELEAQGITLTDDGRQKKKKKKAKGAMTLNEFQQLDNIDQVVTKKHDDTDEEEVASIPSPVAHVCNPDTKFFESVQSDVNKILQKEKIQEEYQKSFAVENIRTQKYQEDLEKKEQEIKTLTETHKDMEKELKQVKKRNQQLCHILSQGEMKDKTKILMEVDELRQEREELTEEVTRLTTELEKERSKVHQLQSELSKSKGGKHK